MTDAIHMEIELKLLLDPRHADALRRHPLLAQYGASAPRELQLSDIYYDTPRQEFRESGAGLRVRQAGGQWIQALKGGGDSGSGLHRRHEWESVVPGESPDLPALRKMIGRKEKWGDLLRAPSTEEGLAPVFRTRVVRTLWDLTLPGGTTIEMALDQGRLECGDDVAEVSEIELELTAGDAVALFDLALALQQDIPMQVGAASKAERGYALNRPAPRQAARAKPVKLARMETVEDAFRAIAAGCLAQVQANADGVGQGYDEECLHQMRVGLRRFRSALGVFKSVLLLPPGLPAELDWLTGELGNARDWDVMAGATLPSLAGSMPAGQGLVDVTQAALDTGHEAQVAAAAAVNSQRYTRLMLMLGRWLYGNGWRPQAAGQGRRKLNAAVDAFARKQLRGAHRKLKNRGRALADGTPEARHRVRIAAKKMRYAGEFFASLYAGKQVKAFISALSELQDELGLLNDATVAEKLLGQLDAARGGLTGPIASVRAALAARAADTGKAKKTWKRYAAVKLPR
ncbi:MAG: CYTH and CHAD domain-containing protein [Telluria sp.]